MTTLSNLIQNHIIILLYKNNYKFTLKPKKYYKLQWYNFNIKYYKSISKYSFVCKHWFYYIRSLFNQCSLSFYKDYPTNLYTVGVFKNGKFTPITINNEYSFFQFDNITHLYLDLNHIRDRYRDIDFIVYLSKFSNLEEIIISTKNLQFVNDITNEFAKLKLELETIDSVFDKYDINQLNDSGIDFIHLTSILGFVDQQDIYNHFKRVNSLYLACDDTCTLFHFEHSDIFTIKSLQYVNIEVDCVYGHDLIKVVKDNDHIISFRGSVPLFIVGCEEDEIVHTDCRCYPYESDDQPYLRDNKLGHWIEFCEHLSTNTTLKSFHLLNYCAFDGEHYISEDTQQQMSDAFCSALESNKTMDCLSIPCGILTDSFYKRFSEINQTIQYISFEDVDMKDLELIGDLIKENCTIRTVKINIRLKRMSNDKTIESFFNALNHNQSLVTLKINTRGYNTGFKESIKNAKELKCRIKIQDSNTKNI